MEAGVTVNLTAVKPDTLHPCYEIYHFNQTVIYTPSIMCVFLCIFLVSLSFITVCGNLLVIISIIYFKQLHTPTNYLVVSLAVADLLTGIIVCPFTIAFSMTACHYDWTAFCTLRGIIDLLLSTCSIMNLGCISIDRYYAVCHPLTYRTKMSRHVVAIMILVSWGLPALTGIGNIQSLLYGESCHLGCMYFAQFVLIISFLVPVIVMICIFCIYLKIFIVAQRQVRSIQNTICQSTKSGGNVGKMERKATKTLTIVVGVYLLCYIPYFFSRFIGIITFAGVLTPTYFREILTWIQLSNSMLNPFIYAFFYSWFRSAIRMIISGKIFQGDFTNSQLH